MTDKETRKKIVERRKKRIRRKQIKKITGIAVCVLLAVVAVSSVTSFFKDDTYRTENEFKEYATACFNNNNFSRISGMEGEEQVFNYGEPLSSALKYPKTGNYITDDFVADRVDEIRNNFYNQHSEADEDEKIMKLVDYAVFETPKSVTGMVLIEEEHVKSGGEMVVQNRIAHTYNFSTKTGGLLNNIQIFNVGFKYQVSEYLDKYFTDKHRSKLTDNYRDYLTVKTSTLNDFVLTEHGVVFFFMPGTVLEESEGMVQAEITYSDLNGIIREDVDFRGLDPQRPMVALTYDDGPYPKTGNRILDCLQTYNAAATFFEVGRNVRNFPEVTERKVQLGMEIGNHSWSHPDLTDLEKKDVKKQIRRTNEAINDAAGVYPTLFRPPYGSTNGKINDISNLPVILWSVDTLDWKSRDADKVVKAVKKVEEKGGLNGRVILMHSIYDSTAEATEELVPWLLEEGYQLVTVSELMKYKYDEEPKDEKFYGYGYFYLD